MQDTPINAINQIQPRKEEQPDPMFDTKKAAGPEEITGEAKTSSAVPQRADQPAEAGESTDTTRTDAHAPAPRCIIACDFDGTLYRHDGRGFLPEDLAAIQNFRAQGGLVGINTGRCVRSIPNGLRPDELDLLDQYAFDFTVGSSGAEIADAKGELMKETPIDWTTIEQLDQLLPCFISFAGVDGHYWRNIRSVTPFSADSPKYDQLDELKGRSICTLSLLEEDPECTLNLDELDLMIRQSGLPVESYYNMESIDIVPKGVSKASALSDLARLFGVDMEHVYAIGDGMNDAPALQAAALGFAIASGDPGLQEYADVVVEDLAEALAVIEQREGMNCQ